MSILALITGWLAACGGGGDDAGGSPPPHIPDPFADVDRAASAAFTSQGLSGMGVVVYDASGTRRFDYGSTHLHVAARMAEVVTGESWASVFATQLKTPLAFIAMEVTESQAGIVAFSVQLELQLKPLIREALR